LKPQLLFFHSHSSGLSRRAERNLAALLAPRRNQEAFELRTILQERNPDLFERFRVEVAPTLIVVEDRKVRARLDICHGSRAITTFLKPWLA